MSARRLLVGVYWMLAERCEGGAPEVDRMLAGLDATPVEEVASRAVTVHALGGEVG